MYIVISSYMEKYGEAHREAKRQRLDRLSKRECEITKQGGRLDNHHNVPRCFGGNDAVGNALALESHFHQKLHDLCYVSDPERFRQRAIISKSIYKNPLGKDVDIKKEKIRKIDEVLVPQYIERLTTKFHHSIQETVTQTTLVRAFENVRDLNMRNRELEFENEQLKRELEHLRNSTEQNKESTNAENNHKGMQHIPNHNQGSVFYPFHL